MVPGFTFGRIGLEGSIQSKQRPAANAGPSWSHDKRKRVSFLRPRPSRSRSLSARLGSLVLGLILQFAETLQQLFRDFGEFLVGLFLFSESLLEKIGGLLVA